MKNNYFASKNYKTGLVVLFVLFYGLFVNEASAQSPTTINDTFIWNGSKSSDWADTANWTILRGTTTAGVNLYPGENTVTDWVFVNKNDTPYPAILDNLIVDIQRLYVNNSFGTESGAIFTINAGATLAVGNATTQSNNVFMNGGNIVNNGTFIIKALGAGFSGFPSFGINGGTPPVLPTVPTEYTYSGSGLLKINMVSANFNNAAAIAVTGASGTTTTPTNSANVTYRFVLNNPEITLNQTIAATPATIYVFRAAGGNNANKMIIGGTGVTLELLDDLTNIRTPSIGGLFSFAGGSSVVIESGTTLTMKSKSTNLTSAIVGFSNSILPNTFINKGTINVQGASSRSGLIFSTGSTSNASVVNFNNEGILNINADFASAQAPLAVGNGGGGAANAGSVANLNNTGTILFKNTSTAVGTGFPVFTVTAGEAPPFVINNSGTMDLEGSTYAFGLKTTINNNGILNSNSELRSFVAVNNNLGGSLNFVKTATTATTKLVVFNGLTTASAAAVGTTYTDSNSNVFAVVSQKFSSLTTGTALSANVLSSANVAPAGTLTKTGTGAGDATIEYATVSISAGNTAVTGAVRNSGTINTDSATHLNIISGFTTTSSSVLSPGGDTRKGLALLGKFAGELLTLNGTLKMQVSGSATAGVDYDAIQVLNTLDVIDITSATLDLTGIYIPTAVTTIDIITTNATPLLEGGVIGNFSAVIGMPSGWKVVYVPGLGGKVQLNFDPANLSTAENNFSNFEFSAYPNPTSDELNVSAAKNISKVEFFNVLGQKVQSITVNATQKQLSISNLQNGLYIMEVTIDNDTETFKIMKQ